MRTLQVNDIVFNVDHNGSTYDVYNKDGEFLFTEESWSGCRIELEHNFEDYVDDKVKESFVMENFIQYCEDMKVAEEGAQIDSFKIYVSKDTREMKKTYRAAKKLMKKDPEEAVKLFNEVIEKANDLKKRVHEIKDDAKKYRLLSLFNPLLMFVKNEVISGAISTGNVIVFTTTTYPDKMSKAAKNAMQEQIQEALNLVIKNSKDYIEYINKRATMKLRKIK